MSHFQKFELLNNIFSLLNAEDYESSIANIAADCHLPLPYMRNVLITLLKNRILSSCLYIRENEDLEDHKALIRDEESLMIGDDGSLTVGDDDFLMTGDDDSLTVGDDVFLMTGDDDSLTKNNDFNLMEAYLEDPETIGRQILAGDHDQVIWDLSLNILDSREQELLPLTRMEYGALRSLGENTLSLKRQSLFEKKDSIHPVSTDVRKNQGIILTAIAVKKAVAFSYRKADGTIVQEQCYPVDLTTNVSDNWIYMRSTDEKSYRLDRFTSICRITGKSDAFPDYEKDPKRKYAWGSFYDKNLEPEHVKVQIAPETQNIIRKIRNDIRHRKDTCSFYRKGYYYYYEDDVIGIPEFQRWIRSYGSSIVVLEPQSLRDNIVKRAHEALDYYEQSKNWKI